MRGRSWWDFLGRDAGVEGQRVLDRDQVLRLPGRREGWAVRVMAGTVVVSREGDPLDHVLERGAELRVRGRGLALAWALEPSRIEVRRAGAERAGERPVPDVLPVSTSR